MTVLRLLMFNFYSAVFTVYYFIEINFKEIKMKNFTSKLTAGLLCAATLVSLLASCADNEDVKKPAVTGITSESEDGKPTFVEADFDGVTFTILSVQDEATDFIDHYIDNETMTGEPINDSVIERNQLVEEKYNVDVVRRKEGIGYAVQAAKSGTVDFEVVYDWGIRMTNPATEGVFYDLKQVNNVDLDQRYWAPSSQDDLTIADKLLIFTNDISMNRIGWASFIFFNKRIVEDLNYTIPYDYVNNNTWTYDKYLEMLLGAAQDNGDNIWNQEDQYGTLSNSAGELSNFVYWSGFKGTTKNEDGTYKLDVYSDKLVSIYQEYSDKLATTDAYADDHGFDWAEGQDISMYPSIFKARRILSFGGGKSLFANFTMDMTQELIDMEDYYGVVPNPKYTSAQTEYYHYIDGCAPMFAIMKQAKDIDMVGTILEYMAYESENLLLPAFYEQTIKTKRMSDLEGRDEAMLDIIRDSVHYNWTGLYYQSIKNAEGEGWDPVGTMLGEMLAAGNFSSVNKKYLSAAQKSIDDLYDTILALDVNK